MSFKCGICGVPSKGRPKKTVTRKRQKKYSNGGAGIEAAEVRDLCDACSTIWRDKEAKMVEAKAKEAAEGKVEPPLNPVFANLTL